MDQQEENSMGGTRVVGLISGGKDSLFNLLCCKSFGFEVSALANLLPPDDTVEADSYMYQSIGKELIPLISECMEVPLVRRYISGKAINQEMNYNATSGDEVEDLFELLKSVKETFPDIQGVSCGAVMSNYQRNRLEEVCHRLKLQSYCFMWMIPEHALLKSIIDSGLICMVVKVASFGLDGSFLGRMISESVEDFDYIQDKICGDFHCCGEGGEYESLTIDGPNHLFKKRYISIDSFQSICLDSNPYAPVCVLKPTEYRLREKEERGEEDVRAVLPFLDQSRCLFYYLCDTGRYRLARFGSDGGEPAAARSSQTGSEPRHLEGPEEPFQVRVFETHKTFVLAVELGPGPLDFCLFSREISRYILENLSLEDWFVSSRAVSFDALILLSEDQRAVGVYELSELWDTINSKVEDVAGTRWKPVVNVSFTKSTRVRSSRFQVVIVKHSVSGGEQGLVRGLCSSSVSSYGTAVPRSFSNCILVSNKRPFDLLCEFRYKSGSVMDSPILLSSNILGLIPHSGVTPSRDQKRSFLKMVSRFELEDSHVDLCIELSLSLRSFRCDLNSSIYSSHLLSSKKHVDFRLDVFNVVHIWIVEISIDEAVSLSEVADYFKSLVNEYNYNENYGSNEWSSIQKFIQASDHPSINPIVIPVLVDYLPLNTICKLAPISFIMDDYRDYSAQISDSNSGHWSLELRSFSGGQAVALSFELKETERNPAEIWEEIARDLKMSTEDALEKHGLSLNDKVVCSKFLVLDAFCNLINQSQDPLIRASFVSPVKMLPNSSILRYILVVSH